MKETDYEDFDRHRSSHSHVAKKKCKKRRSPPVDEVDVKHRFHRRDDDFEPRKKESRLKEYNDEPRRKERDYDNGESRRKDHHDHRKKESRREYEDGGEYSGKDKEHHRDRHSKKKCSKHKEHRSSDKRKNDDRNRVKQEPLSDSESDGDRTQSPRNYSNRGDKKPSNLDALMNVKEVKEWGLGDDKEKKKPVVNTAKPDFGLSGKLAEETNIVNGVVIKYSEPEEARKPKIRWRLYPFKGDTSLPILHIHRQSAYLVGRDRKIADLPVDHPSCSKQHAVLQYRLVPFTRPNGTQGKRVRLYVLDLESANGTFINNNKIEPKKYVELLERDVIKFGFSSREYVLLHEHSKDDHLDDDVE